LIIFTLGDKQMWYQWRRNEINIAGARQAQPEGLSRGEVLWRGPSQLSV